MSSVPPEVYKNIKETQMRRLETLQGGSENTGYSPVETLKDAEKANKEAKTILDKALNEREKANTADLIGGYSESNGVVALARDNMASDLDRIKAVAGYLNELTTDVLGDRIGFAIPGHDNKTE